MGTASVPKAAEARHEVIRVTVEGRPAGPADNAIIVVEQPSGRARYLSWIGYFDLDCASALAPGQWTIIEPARDWQAEVDWQPFGPTPRAPNELRTWNGGPTDGLLLPRDGGVMQPARRSRYRRSRVT